MTGRRIWTLALAGMMALAITFVLRPTAVSAKAPTETTIDGCKKKKKGVKFAHAKHVKALKGKATCKTCHHKAGKDKKCTTCHAKPVKDMGTCFKASKKKNPIHKQCIGCHAKMKKGPTKCKECHK